MNNEIFNNNIFKLMDICKPNNNKNIIISGLSIKMALAMLLNGSEGNSKKELIAFLGKNKEELNIEISKILIECGESLKLANSFWIAKPNQINEKYRQVIKKYQAAEIYLEDFRSSEIVDIINNWATVNTNGLIKEIIENEISTATALLINTLYFKAQWKKSFDEYLTHKDIFYGIDESNNVQMMKTITKTYFENEHAEGFSISYKDTPYEFIAVLPKKEGIFKIEELDLNNFCAKTGNYNVNVDFPKLNIEFGTELKKILQLMGLQAPFVNSDDFKLMLSIPQNVDKIIHKTNFKLDEKGTEAAAATIVEMKRGMTIQSEMPIEINLIFNRPFAFIIRNITTHELLFVGKINNL